MDTTTGTDISGLWVPIITPFRLDGSLDVDGLERLAGQLLDDGAAGLVALGTTGEPATLEPAERRAVVEICDAACSARDRPLMVGAGTFSTKATIDEIEYLCADTTASSALIVAPYYTRPSEAAIVEHFELVADASSVPLVIYNIPYRTGRALSAESVLQASTHPNIIGLKQSVAALDLDTLDVLARTGSGFSTLAGDDAFIAPTVLLGAAGAIAAAAHMATGTFVEMVVAARSDDSARARELATALLPVVTAGFAEPSPAVWKAALARRGIIASPTVRRPMTAASSAATDGLLTAVEQLTPSTIRKCPAW